MEAHVYLMLMPLNKIAPTMVAKYGPVIDKRLRPRELAEDVLIESLKILQMWGWLRALFNPFLFLALYLSNSALLGPSLEFHCDSYRN
jgi:hypothetical protein